MKTSRSKAPKVLQVTVTERLCDKYIQSKTFTIYEYDSFTESFKEIKKAIEEL